MQTAKDTFYVMMRDGVSGLNAQRTAVVRGVLRPGVLVEENELPMAISMPDVFCLRWTGVTVDTTGTVPLAKLQCEIRYETAGTEAAGGLDRGRLLATMDCEINAVLAGETQSAAKMDFSQGTPTPAGTRIFWSDPAFRPAEIAGERLRRTVVIEVWSVEEAGER